MKRKLIVIMTMITLRMNHKFDGYDILQEESTQFNRRVNNLSVNEELIDDDGGDKEVNYDYAFDELNRGDLEVRVRVECKGKCDFSSVEVKLVIYKHTYRM